MKAYDVFGPISRKCYNAVFEGAWSSQLAAIDEAISYSDPSELLPLIGSGMDVSEYMNFRYSKHPFLLIQNVKGDPTFSDMYLTLVSKFALNRLVNQRHIGFIQRLRTIYRESRDALGAPSDLAVMAYKQLGHIALSTPSQVTFIPISIETPPSVTLPAAFVPFARGDSTMMLPEALDSMGNTCWFLWYPSLIGFDAIGWRGEWVFAFQFAVSNTCSVRARGIEQFKQLFQTEDFNRAWIFVTPEEDFHIAQPALDALRSQNIFPCRVHFQVPKKPLPPTSIP